MEQVPLQQIASAEDRQLCRRSSEEMICRYVGECHEDTEKGC